MTSKRSSGGHLDNNFKVPTSNGTNNDENSIVYKLYPSTKGIRASGQYKKVDFLSTY